MSVELEAAPSPGTGVDYRGTFGWPVEWHQGGLRLVTGSGVGAVVVPRALSEVVLASLARQGCSGPAVALPTRRERVTVLLVEADDVAVAETPLPSGVRVLPAGSAIPLPGERGTHTLARWIVEPDPSQRWLPSLGSVLTVISSSTIVRPGALVW
ncbi:hypothetical protein B0I33_10157 [Prauserella shujinwangii]|uniref:Bifunctional DNA primase/polymerase-like protein n=1 Tax=Prauserella shujinwangii TaxID=1453103 RepID=A0A2T0M2F5_9PSEU|nr:hypothetical protein [Prauserella shujinwangii]PRX50906.1 hypothetical protein B0I33_10157 [Prauserella shujinwangii]